MPTLFRDCLACGMRVSLPMPAPDEAPQGFCPKCNANLFSQSDGSCLTLDIAHQGETVSQAMAKLEDALWEAQCGHYQKLRLIVGGGLIREEVGGQLHFLLNQGRILGVLEEGHNRGAFLVQVRR